MLILKSSSSDILSTQAFTISYLLNLHNDGAVSDDDTGLFNLPNLKTSNDLVAALNSNSAVVCFRSSDKIEPLLKQNLLEVKGKKVTIIMSREPEVGNAIRKLLEDLKYDEDFQSDYMHLPKVDSSQYYLENYLKDVRVQIFLKDGLSIIAIDR